MTDDAAGIRSELESLNVEFWYLVDHHGGEGVQDLFTEVSVSDVEDEYVRGEDGSWRIEHRHITEAFRGEEPAVLSFAPEAPDEVGAG